MIRRVVSIQRNEHDAFDLILSNQDPDCTHHDGVYTVPDDWGASWQQDHEELPVEMIIEIAASTTHLSRPTSWRRGMETGRVVLMQPGILKTGPFLAYTVYTRTRSA